MGKLFLLLIQHAFKLILHFLHFIIRIRFLFLHHLLKLWSDWLLIPLKRLYLLPQGFYILYQMIIIPHLLLRHLHLLMHRVFDHIILKIPHHLNSNNQNFLLNLPPHFLIAYPLLHLFSLVFFREHHQFWIGLVLNRPHEGEAVKHLINYKPCLNWIQWPPIYNQGHGGYSQRLPISLYTDHE